MSEDGVVADDEIAETHKTAGDAHVVVIYGDRREVHVPVLRGLTNLREAEIKPTADARRASRAELIGQPLRGRR